MFGVTDAWSLFDESVTRVNIYAIYCYLLILHLSNIFSIFLAYYKFFYKYDI